jgi:Glycosyl hydrolase family 3 C-terminal domain/Glycosyl hydrolase family 3 N terminal domain
MCSYNKLHGTHLSAHPMLDDLLRSEWGFDGVVVSDWGAVHDTVGPGLSGLDVEMPGPPEFWGDKLVEAVRSGAVPEARINEKVQRIIRLARRTRALGRESAEPPPTRDRSATSSLLRRAAIESFVLLKNENEMLPLASPARIAVLGPHAAQPALQGGGSANVGPSFGATPLEGIRRLASEAVDVVHEPGYVPALMPRLDLGWVGEGFTVELVDARDPSRGPLRSETQRTNLFIWDKMVGDRPPRELIVRLRATLTPVGIENSVRSGCGQIAGVVDGVGVSQPFGLGSDASASTSTATPGMRDCGVDSTNSDNARSGVAAARCPQSSCATSRVWLTVSAVGAPRFRVT